MRKFASLFLVLVLLLITPSMGWSAIALVGNTTASEDTTDASNTIGAFNLPGGAGTVLACWLKWEGNEPTITSITDTAGNTFTSGTQVNNGGTNGEPRGRFIYVVNPTGNATNTITITWNSVVSFKHHLCAWFSGTGAFDIGGAGAQGSTSPATSDSVTTTQNNDLCLFGVSGYTGSESFTSPTIGGTAATDLGKVSDTTLFYLLDAGTAGSKQGSVNHLTNRFSANIACFKIAAAGGSVIPRGTLMGVLP